MTDLLEDVDGSPFPEEVQEAHRQAVADLLVTAEVVVDLQQAIIRVLELHQQDATTLEEGAWCPACGDAVPCRTVRAIAGSLQ